MKKLWLSMLMSFTLISISACAPEIGSEAWCKKMTEKEKGDWTGNEAADFAKHCLFK